MPLYSRSVSFSISNILLHILSRKYLSCEITITAPLYDERKSSSHWIAFISRWFVGSSSKRRSEPERRIFARRTLVRCPPDSFSRGKDNSLSRNPSPRSVARQRLLYVIPPSEIYRSVSFCCASSHDLSGYNSSFLFIFSSSVSISEKCEKRDKTSSIGVF